MDLKLQVLLQMLDKASAPLKRLQGASKATGDALRKTRDALRQLDQVQKQVGEFRTLKQGSLATSQRLKAVNAQIQQTVKAMRACGVPTETMARRFDELTKRAEALKVQEAAQVQKLQQLRGQLGAAGVSTRHLSAEERRLRGETQAANASLKQQTDHLRAQSVHAQRLDTMRTRLGRGQALAANLSIAGYGAMQTGRHLLDGIHPSIAEAKAFQAQEAQLRSQGIGDAAVADAIQFAKGMDIMGSSATDNLRMLKEAYTVLRDMHEAEEVTPFLAKMKFGIETVMAQGGHGEGHGAQAETMFADLLKTAELRGAAKSPESLKRVINFATQAYVASGGMITSEDMLQMIKTGGVAAKQLDDQSFFFGLLHTMQEMGGFRTGTGLATAYQNWAAGRTTQQSAEELSKLGLINPEAVKYGKTGHITKLLPGALKDIELYESNPFQYLMDKVIPAINPDGKLGDKQVVSKINALFSGRKGGDLFASMYLERANIAKHLAAAPKAFGVDALYDEAGRTAAGQEATLQARKADLYRELGTQLLPLYVGALEKLVSVLRSLSGFAARHPMLAKGLTLVAGSAGLLMAAVGGLMIALGGLVGQFALLRFAVSRAGLGLLAGGGASGGGLFARLGALGRSVFPAIAGGARAAMLAITGVSLPVLALVAALTVAAMVIWKYWEPIKAFFVGMGQGIADVMRPAIAGLGQALAPLQPALAWLAEGLGAAWHWLTALFEPLHATSAQLAAAQANGVSFGQAVGYVLAGVVTAVTWVVQAFTWLGAAIGEGIGWIVVHGSQAAEWLQAKWSEVIGFMAGVGEAIKQPFVVAFQWIADKIDWIVAKWQGLKNSLRVSGDESPAAKRNWGWNDGAVPPSRFAIDSPPLRAGAGTSSTQNSYDVKVYAAPGSDPRSVAREVSAELDRRERAKAAAQRSLLSDHD